MKKSLLIIVAVFITASFSAQEVKERAVYSFVNAVENVGEETQYVFMSEKSLLVSVTDQGYYKESYVFIPYIDTVEVYGRYVKIIVNENNITTIKANSERKALEFKEYLGK